MGKKILIIDDEKDFCSVMKAHLEAISDFKVDTAYTGKSGIVMARKAKPDLIVLDILLPDMIGHEVLERLKKDEKTMSIPVLILSAVGDIKSQIKATNLYGEEYLVKPVKAADLKVKIEEILARFGKV